MKCEICNNDLFLNLDEEWECKVRNPNVRHKSHYRIHNFLENNTQICVKHIYIENFYLYQNSKINKTKISYYKNVDLRYYHYYFITLAPIMEINKSILNKINLIVSFL